MENLNSFSIIVPPEDFGDSLSPEMIKGTIEDIFSGTNVSCLRGIIIEIKGYLYPLVISFDYPSKQLLVSRAIGG